MGNFHPTQTRLLAAPAEESHASARQSIVGPEIHYLALGRDGEVVAAHIHLNAIQSIVAGGNRKRLYHVWSLFAVDHRVPDYLDLWHWTGPYNHELERVEIVQVCGAESA